MSLRINTNVAGMNALRNLGIAGESVGRTIERLSSGLRVVRAGDDPAGLIISENLRSYIGSISQAVNNNQDAANLVKTAEAALDETHNALRAIRQLVIHAGNTGVNDSTALQADQTQVRSLIESIDRIATQSSFGGKKLLDGTGGIAAQVTDPSRLAGAYIGGTFAGAATASGYVSVSVVTPAARAIYTGTVAYGSLASTINQTGSIVLNGQTIAFSAGDTVQTLMDKINAAGAVTGVSAQFSTTAGAAGMIKLTHREFGSQHAISFHDAFGAIATAGTGVNNAGTDGVANVQAMTANGPAAALFTGGRATGDSGLRLRDAYGNSLLLTEQGNLTTGTVNLAVVTAGNLQFQVGPSAGNWVRFSLFDARANRLGTTVAAGRSVATIDVTNVNQLDQALAILDEAIMQVSSLRGDLGSFQRNIVETNIRSLNIAKENLAASESQIRDADFAAEVTALTKQQILMQSGLSVLAQANSIPQQVLSLLR